MTKPCIYCGVPVLITVEEEKRLTKYGISVDMVRVSCSKCDDRKLQPMMSEDG
jgi:RNase P subunit RPR2